MAGARHGYESVTIRPGPGSACDEIRSLRRRNPDRRARGAASAGCGTGPGGAARRSRSSRGRCRHAGRSPSRGPAPPGRDVVVDDRELAVGDGRPPERLAAAAKRRRRPTGEMAEGVVGRRARILVPPVAAGQAVVAEPNARVGVEPIDRRPERVRPERCRAVALTVMGREAAVPDPRRPRACDAASALEQRHCRDRRAKARRDDLDPLRAPLQRKCESERQHCGAQSTLPPRWPLCRRSTLRSPRLRPQQLGRSWHPGCPVGPAKPAPATRVVRRLRRPRAHRRARRRRGRHARGDDGLPQALRRPLSDPADATGVALRRQATTARPRPTTPRRSTAATRSQPGRSAGRLTPTARRSTSTTSRIPTCSGAG